MNTNIQNSQPVVVVSGLPRSGTSMMMQMIRAGGLPALSDGVRPADEDNPRGYFEFEAVKKTKVDASWLDDAPGKVVKLVHLLLTDLPTTHTYKVLFMRRSMDEVLASQQKMLERMGRVGAKISPAQLGAMFQQQMDRIEQHMQGNAHFDYLDVNYAAVVRDPAAHVQSIADFLDMGLDTKAMIAAVDPELYRNRLV